MPQALRGWYHQGPTQRGRQNTFSDLAIQTALMLRLVSALPLRQTEGFLKSILALMGVDLRVPDHTTLCRRQGDLNVDLPVQSRHAPIHLVVDSTGLKGYGEGEGLKSRGKGTNLATTTFMQQRRCQCELRVESIAYLSFIRTYPPTPRYSLRCRLRLCLRGRGITYLRCGDEPEEGTSFFKTSSKGRSHNG